MTQKTESTGSDRKAMILIVVFALVVALGIDFLAYIIAGHSDLFRALLG